MATLHIPLLDEDSPLYPEDQNGIWSTSWGPLVLSHARPDGRLEDWAEAFLQENPTALVVSCFPRAVRSTHPQARVVGHWDGITHAIVPYACFGEHLYLEVYPAGGAWL